MSIKLSGTIHSTESSEWDHHNGLFVVDRAQMPYATYIPPKAI